MIAAHQEPLSRVLHVLPGFQWLFDKHFVTFGLILLVISPVGLWLNDILLVRSTIVPPSWQWYSALADLFLALAGLVMHWAVQGLGRTPSWLDAGWKHLLIVLFWCAWSVWHMVREWDSLPRHSGPNYWYHNYFVVPVLGYVLSVLLIAVCANLFLSWRIVCAFLVTVLCACIWVGAGVYDSAHQYTPLGVSKHTIANPRDPWHGLLPRVYRWLRNQ